MGIIRRRSDMGQNLYTAEQIIGNIRQAEEVADEHADEPDGSNEPEEKNPFT
jgi:hypothetical protein